MATVTPNPYTQEYYRQQNPAPASQTRNPMGDPSDYYGSRGRSVRGWYQQYLGRDADEEGYRGWVNGNMTLADIEQAIAGSPEARARRASGANTPQGSPGGANRGGGIFSDPATQTWEMANNLAAGRLLQPQANPDFQPYVEYMRKYLAQLQQPGYTPAQQDLIQTQSLEPMEQQRAAAREQVRQRFAQRGVEGGVVEKAMQDVDRQFNQMRTRTQAGFATNQIAYDQARQQQAAQVAASLSQAQQAAATNDEGRMMQALALLFQIPQYADTRLSLANSVMQPLNPASLLQALGGINASNQGQNNFNAQQNSFFWSQLGQLLANAFGG